MLRVIEKIIRMCKRDKKEILKLKQEMLIKERKKTKKLKVIRKIQRIKGE